MRVHYFVAVPESGTICGLPPPLSVTYTFAVCAPEPRTGLYSTVIEQLAPVPSEDGQLSVASKLVQLSPCTAIPLTVIGIFPVFVSLICCGGLVVSSFCGPNVRLVGEKVTIVPAPKTSIICGLVDALPTIEIVPPKLPCVAGEKVMLRSQVPPGATLLPQVEVALYGFVAAIEERERGVVPLFVSETACGALVVPTN